MLIIFQDVKNEIENKRILITGGTSGLGRSLVTQFLTHHASVAATGRNDLSEGFNHPNYTVYTCDHSSLEDVKNIVGVLANKKTAFDILINNAGVLSPPKFLRTVDGFEFSYQVNFLSHVLLTRLLLKHGLIKTGLVINISSPIYIRGKLIGETMEKYGYGVFQSYSNTKLYMALFSNKLAEEGISGFSFNPGTFSSGIYRQQYEWFHVMYKIASPFMTSSDEVAKALFSIISDECWSNGGMVNKKGRVKQINEFDAEQRLAFWHKVESQIKDYLI